MQINKYPKWPNKVTLNPSTVDGPYIAECHPHINYTYSKFVFLHKILVFSVGRAMPATSDYTDISPMLEESEPEAHNISQAQVFGHAPPNSVARETVSVAILMLPVIYLSLS